MKYSYAEQAYDENLCVIEETRMAIDRMIADDSGFYGAKYLEIAKDVLGGYCQIGSWGKIPLSLWFGMFARTKIGTAFGHGDIVSITLCSANELANDVMKFYYGVTIPVAPSYKVLELGRKALNDRRHLNFGRNMALLSWYMRMDFATMMFAIPVYEAFTISCDIMDAFAQDGQYLFVHEMNSLYEHRKLYGLPLEGLEELLEQEK